MLYFSGKSRQKEDSHVPAATCILLPLEGSSGSHLASSIVHQEGARTWHRLPTKPAFAREVVQTTTPPLLTMDAGPRTSH